MVANIRDAWAKDKANAACRDSFAAAFDAVLQDLQADPEAAIPKLAGKQCSAE